MREPTYFILAALQDEPRHGYAIITRVAELSGRRVTITTGTLYQALDRLAREGLIEVVRDEVVNGRARRHYALTSDGRSALQAEAERMAAAADVVLRASTADGALRASAPDAALRASAAEAALRASAAEAALRVRPA